MNDPIEARMPKTLSSQHKKYLDLLASEEAQQVNSPTPSNVATFPPCPGNVGYVSSVSPPPPPSVPGIAGMYQNTPSGSSNTWIAFAIPAVVILFIVIFILVNNAQESARVEQARVAAQQAQQDAENVKRAQEASQEAQRKEQVAAAQREETRREIEDAEKAQAEEAESSEKASKPTTSALGVSSTDDDRYFTAYEAWLRKRSSSLGANGVTVTIHNACPTKAAYLAIRYKVPDDTGHWVTVGWWTIEPGKAVSPLIATDNRVVYFYAETAGAVSRWDGSSSSNSITAAVVERRFEDEDGVYTSWTDAKSVSFVRLDIDSSRKAEQNLTCN